MLDSPVCSPIRSRRESSLSACSSTASGIFASSILARYSSTTEASIVAAQLEDLLDDRAVLALELARAPVDRVLVLALVHLHAQLASGARLGSPDQSPVLAGDGHGVAAAGQADALGDLRDRAHLEELVVVAGHEHHALVIAHVDRERNAHVGEHHGVVERDQAQQRLLLAAGQSLVVLCWGGHGYRLHRCLLNGS